MSGGMIDMAVGLQRYANAINAAALTGGNRAGIMLINDVLQTIPTAPKKEGELRGSGTVHTQGKCVHVAENVGGNPTPNTDPIDPPKAGTVEVAVGFNKVYAAAQHEGGWISGPLAGVQIQKYTEPSSGAKFIEKKIATKSDDYFAEWNKTIRAAHERRGPGA
jgi:hypothetical protein